MGDVIYLSVPAPVSMADEWFGLATPRHFWIQRRFEVLRRLARGLDFRQLKIGEIGCGHGLVQQQFAEHYGVKVDGFDLNEAALRQSAAGDLPRFCYNVLECNPKLAASYDLLVLFDVLEHIEDEGPFLKSVVFHLKPGGRLLLNVPAFMSLYSRYDDVVGHWRRYRTATLQAACARAGLSKVTETYWGLPWVPILWLRKLWLARLRDAQTVTRRGFKPPGGLGNWGLGCLGRLEPLPQRVLGSSLMAIYKIEAGA